MIKSKKDKENQIDKIAILASLLTFIMINPCFALYPTSNQEANQRNNSIYPLDKEFIPPTLIKEQPEDSQGEADLNLTSLNSEEIAEYTRYQQGVVNINGRLCWKDTNQPLNSSQVMVYSQYQGVLEIGGKFYWSEEERPIAYNPDVNLDESVDRTDLIAITRNLNLDLESVSQCDLNQDKKINLSDLAIALGDLKLQNDQENNKDLLGTLKNIGKIVRYLNQDLAKLKRFDLNKDRQIDSLDLSLVAKAMDKGLRLRTQKDNLKPLVINQPLDNHKKEDIQIVPRIKELQLEQSGSLFHRGGMRGPQDKVKMKTLPLNR
jgi:hypothetical protein